MARTGRTVLAVVAGAVVWAALWVGGAQAAQSAFPSILAAGQPVTHTGALIGLILYSVALSMVAGYVTAAIAQKNAMPAVWSLATLQLALGIGFEVSAWNLTPVWYHVVFLALVVPATVYGGLLRVRRRQAQVGVSDVSRASGHVNL
jgi:Na+-translocating ferredoxin:NAD+ oxidoreductase RnfD subunit